MDLEYLKDYYKILNSRFSDSERVIYKRFKKLVNEFVKEFDHQKNSHFQLLNESYFILSNKTYRKLYDHEYKKQFLNDTEINLDAEQYKILDTYIKRAQAKAFEVSIIPFDKYSEQILKRPTLLSVIWEFISTIGS